MGRVDSYGVGGRDVRVGCVPRVEGPEMKGKMMKSLATSDMADRFGKTRPVHCLSCGEAQSGHFKARACEHCGVPFQKKVRGG